MSNEGVALVEKALVMAGVFVAHLLSHWLKTDVSTICAVIGILVG